MALITTIQELKKYNAAANLGTQMETFTPSCTFIEKKILIPEMGRDLYDTLTDAYNASIATNNAVALSQQMADLLDAVRSAITPLAILHYKHSILGILSDSGATERSLENGEPIRMWVNSLQSETLFTEGMAAVEMLLEFLEENKGDYPDWMESDAYTEFHQFIMQTTREFDDEVKIGMSRRLFRALRPDIKYAELQVIKKNIGEDFYNRLLDSLKDDSYTEKELEAMQMINAVTANVAIGYSSLPIEMGNDGIFTLYSDSQFSGYKSTKQLPDMKSLTQMRSNYLRRGGQYLEDLLTFLNKYASETVFPEYYSSNFYTSPADEEDDSETSVNDDLTNIFSA